MPWLTPANANPVGQACRVLLIPDDLEYIQAVTGALLELTYPHNWEQYGAATPDEVAALFQSMLFAYLESECTPVTPVGSMMMIAANSQPDKWLICDGQAVSRTTYADLFAVIGTDFGAGDGTTTFNVPDFRDLSPMGAGGSVVGSPGAVQGELQVALTGANNGTHTHSLSDPGHSHAPVSPNTTFLGNRPGSSNTAPAGSGVGTATATGVAFTGATVNSSGSGTPHNNLHPVMGVYFIIYAGV